MVYIYTYNGINSESHIMNFNVRDKNVYFN